MGYLALSIIATTLIFVVFRFIGKYNVATFQAIVVNYFVSVSFGFVVLPTKVYDELLTMPAPFYQIGLVLGMLFVINFWFMGKATQLFGVAPATIMARISLIIPAFFSILVFGEPFNWLKALGLVAAILAIVFTLYEPGLLDKLTQRSRLIPYLFPLGAFLGTGMIDSLFKVAEVKFLSTVPDLAFLLLLFSIAGLAGLIFIASRYSAGRTYLDQRALPFGFILGVVNFFAIYCLLLALSGSKLDGSVLFPVNSVSIVALSTVLSVFLFKESLNRYNFFGFVLTVAAILFITLA